MATTKIVKEAKLLTARELAEKTGISPAMLRKLLRQEFNRVGKTKVEGNRLEYRFNSTDPVTKQIITRAKALMEKPKETQTPNVKPSEQVNDSTTEVKSNVS